MSSCAISLRILKLLTSEIDNYLASERLLGDTVPGTSPIGFVTGESRVVRCRDNLFRPTIAAPVRITLAAMPLHPPPHQNRKVYPNYAGSRYDAPPSLRPSENLGQSLSSAASSWTV